MITSILVTNKEARTLVATRLREQINSFTVGGNNNVHPVVSIAQVPLRSLNGSAPTLPTSTRATTCPVEAFECKEEGGVDNYVCKAEDIDLLFEDSDEGEDVKEEKDRVERKMDSEEEEEEVYPGGLFRGIHFLTGDMSDKPEDGKLHFMFLLFGKAVTALPMMVTAEICACVMCPASTIIHPVCSVGFIVNHIPNVLLVINLS